MVMLDCFLESDCPTYYLRIQSLLLPPAAVAAFPAAFRGVGVGVDVDVVAYPFPYHHDPHGNYDGQHGRHQNTSKAQH